MARPVRFSALLLGLAAITSAKPVNDDVTDTELRMPGVQPAVADTYLCLPTKTSEDNTYITGFVPHANMSTAHHILLFGCEIPSHTDKVWNCGEMQSTSSAGVEPPCRSMPKIIYAWAMDAPELKLPEGVGFKVGGDTDIKYLVLQVHYKDVSSFTPPNNAKDTSGLTLHTTKTTQPRRAGVYLMSTDGEIPPQSTTYMEAACSIDDDIPIHPFAFRVHAHAHGEVVSGYRVRNGDWTEIGRMSPKKPQMFYNVTHPGLTVEKGDILAARCTMVNDEDRVVDIGQTQKDEMCNFYVMYWMPGDHTMDENFCTTAGPPSWYWNSVSTIHVENAPNDASVIPGTDKILKASVNFANKVENMMEETHRKLTDDFQSILERLQDEEEEEEEELNQLPSFPYDEEEAEIENVIPKMGGRVPPDMRDLMYGFEPGFAKNNIDLNDYKRLSADWPYNAQADYYDDERYYPQY